MKNWSIDELLSYSVWNKAQSYCDRYVLGNPQPNILKECRIDPVAAIQSIGANLDPPLLQAVVDTCLASLLLTPSRLSSSMKNLLRQYISGKELDYLIAFNWKSFPVAIATRNSARIYNFLAGFRGDLQDYLIQDYSASILDREASNAVMRAKKIAAAKYQGGFICWPVPGVQSREIIISGSIGLPTYLGLVSAAEDLCIPELLATGKVDENGALYSVGHLEQKCSAAEKQGFKAVLYPETRPWESCFSSQLELLPVRDLNSAEQIWKQYNYADGRSILKCINNCRNKKPSLKQLAEIPDALLPWIKSRFEEIKHSCLDSMDDGSELQQFVSELERILEEPGCNLEKLQVLTEFLDREKLSEISDKFPELAWRYCILRVAMHNHRGEVEASSAWIDRAKSLENKLVRFETGNQNVVLTYIHYLVGEYHNRYYFQPEILQEFNQQFRELLNEYLSMYEDKKEKGCDPVWPNAGRYYGTMAQNYGFCGPQYLSRTQKYIQKAIEAFGNFKEQYYKDECLRDLSYLFFAYIDTGYYQKAEEVLCNYLEVDDISKFEPTLNTNPFKLFCLYRFLADTGRQVISLVEWAENYLQSFGVEHPYQLIYYNCGRIIQDLEIKKQSLQQSVNSCFAEKSGATKVVMALLPLSELWEFALENEQYFADCVNIAMSPILQNKLYKPHFGVIADLKDWREILDRVEGNKPALFPYSYR